MFINDCENFNLDDPVAEFAKDERERPQADKAAEMGEETRGGEEERAEAPANPRPGGHKEVRTRVWERPRRGTGRSELPREREGESPARRHSWSGACP